MERHSTVEPNTVERHNTAEQHNTVEPDNTQERHKSPLPTRKWMAGQVTAAAAFLTAWVTAGEWNSTLSIAVIGLLAQASISYLIPNVDTPGGVPAKLESVVGGVR